jgi:osmotically-inducible protein OsmY
VELAGHVDSFREKLAAEGAAWRVVHVHQVNNNIRVLIPFGHERADDDIALAAMGALEWNTLIPATVEVQVSNGLLVLSGRVERQRQREEAERAVASLTGITGLRNDLAIQPSTNWADVKAALEAAFRRSALVDGSHIKVHAGAGGVISLRGTVRSRAEYEEAMHTSWSSPGVTKVDDHLAIGSVVRAAHT